MADKRTCHTDSNFTVIPTYTSQHESDIIIKLVGPINRGGGVREPKPPRKIIEISMTQISLKF